mgnify:CR=1 FL=1
MAFEYQLLVGPFAPAPDRVSPPAEVQEGWFHSVVPGCVVACLATTECPLPHPDLQQILLLLLSCWALNKGEKPILGVGPLTHFHWPLGSHR